VLLICSGVVAYLSIDQSEPVEETAKKEAPSKDSFGNYFKVDILADVPAMVGDNLKMGSATDCGAGNYMVDVNGATLEDYQAYLATLESNGFTKYADNGENGLYETAYTATYTKDNLVVTVAHMVKLNKTYITSAYDLPLSPNLIYKEEYKNGMIDGAKTSLSLIELYQSGNSFLIQLKNGHFIVSDGGYLNDLPYLLDYMESLVPAGEKPVVEAWFFTHAHIDHAGVMRAFVDNPEYTQRLLVEGIYYNEPSSKVFDQLDPTTRTQLTYMKMGAKMLRTTSGKPTNIYRPQTGQIYYFCDITVDIVFAQEQIHLTNYAYDFNDSSTWCMVNIEGQKVLMTGDGDDGCFNTIMRAYNSEDFKADVFTVPHHALNVRNSLTDFCKPATVLYTTWKTEDYHHTDYYKRVEENEYLKNISKEWYTWANGTVVLSFPYKVGTAKVLPKTAWIYDNGVNNRENK